MCKTATMPKPARKKMPRAAWPEVFANYSEEKFERYQDYIEALPDCPGYVAVKQILRDASKLQKLIRDTIADHGPGSGSVVARFNEDFDEFSAGDEMWMELTAMMVTMKNCAAFVSSNLPMTGGG